MAYLWGRGISCQVVADWMALLLTGAIVPAWLYTATLAARDADRRGANGGLVGAAWVLLWPIGVVLWIMARTRQLR